MTRNGTDGAAHIRPAKRSDAVAGLEFEPLLVDPATGALIVSGAGAAPAATALKLQDGTVVGQFAAVTAAGEVRVLVSDLGLLATDARLELARALLADIEADTDNLDVLLSSRASEATLTALNGKDFATEATLATKLDVLHADVDGLEGTIFRRTDPIPAGTNQIGSTVPERPTQKAGRTYVQKHSNFQSVDATVHTVTAGKVLYVTSMVFEVFNESTASRGDVAVHDGATNDASTRRMQLGAPANAVGQVSPIVVAALAYAEPLRFTNSVRGTRTEGAMFWSLTIVGYEE